MQTDLLPMLQRWIIIMAVIQFTI